MYIHVCAKQTQWWMCSISSRCFHDSLLTELAFTPSYDRQLASSRVSAPAQNQGELKGTNLMGQTETNSQFFVAHRKSQILTDNAEFCRNQFVPFSLSLSFPPYKRRHEAKRINRIPARTGTNPSALDSGSARWGWRCSYGVWWRRKPRTSNWKCSGHVWYNWP